jgi:hypothetical protein
MNTAPTLEHLYDAIVDVGQRRSLGSSALGERGIIDILGGSFEGPRLRGVVLPGGADRQWLRPDGVKELVAVYEMQTHDGVVIGVDNRVLIDDPSGDAASSPGRYARSVLRLSAPAGAYEWLNRRVLVGTLLPLMPERQAVKIGVYLVR